LSENIIYPFFEFNYFYHTIRKTSENINISDRLKQLDHGRKNLKK